jgi:hypothetical protein
MRRPPPILTRASLRVTAAAAVVSLAAFGPAAAAHAGPDGTAGSRQADFAAAAQRYGVPASVLLGVSYLESRWDAHQGEPSTDGGYGPMNLTDTAYVTAQALKQGEAPEDARGDTSRPLVAPAPPSGPAADQPALRTMATAAALTGADKATLRTDAAANILAGAALLASYQKDLGAPASADPGEWYGAVARYSGATTPAGARDFADEVFQTIHDGMSRTTDDGQQVTLAATAVTPDTGQLARLGLAQPADATVTPECPSGMDCDFVPAAYQLDSADKTDYGNYDLADRPKDMKVQYLVIHDNEGYYNGTISWFQNPKAYVSAHYELRSVDGHVTQMVQTKNVAWQAGNWYINMHSVGIEQEGFAAAGATWYTEALYEQSAKLVRYLAHKYGIPLDRQHILGHGNVPGTTPATIKGMHWDPGPFWDWNHYLDLARGYRLPSLGSPHPDGTVTIDPDFATNQQPVTGCDKSGSGTPCTAQGTSFVYLHTAPSDDAPYVADTGLHAGPGTRDIADWAARAEAGQQYVVAARQGDWVAIWFAGAQGWFRDPRHGSTADGAIGLAVTPARGKTSIPVYGRAYPEADAYGGTTIPVQSVVPLGYTVAAGQRYALGATDVSTDYYYAPTIDSSLPYDHTVVHGKTRYLEIQYGHRVGYVLASDVRIVPAL